MGHVIEVVDCYVTGVEPPGAELFPMLPHISVDFPHLRHGVQDDLGIPF